MLHPRRGHDKRFVVLTDLDWRVYDAYLIGADDFGVMRYSAVSVKSADDGLSARPEKMLLRCLDSLIERGILVDFLDGNRRYVLQFDWQDDQRIKYPTTTYQPRPPDGLVSRCSAKTRKLFGKYPGGKHEEEPEEVEESEKIFPTLENNRKIFSDDNGAGDSLTLTLKHKPYISSKKDSGQLEWFAAFWQSYPLKRDRAKAQKAWLKLNPDEALRAEIALAIECQRVTADWTKDAGRFIPHPSTWLNGRRWEDDVGPPEVIAAPVMSKHTRSVMAAVEAFTRGAS